MVNLAHINKPKVAKIIATNSSSNNSNSNSNRLLGW